MTRVIIDHDEFDALPDLSRASVMAATDVAEVRRWYTALKEKAAELTAFIESMDGAGYETEAAAGKRAFCQIAARWCEHRIIELGATPPYPPTDPRTREITRNLKRIDRLKRQVRELGGDPDESLSPHFEKEAA